MTYIRHNAVIMTSVEDKAVVAEIGAFRESMPEDYQRFLVGPVMGGNGWITFAMLPSGSTETFLTGWRAAFVALAYEIHRREAAKWADGSSPDIVQIVFGGDEPFTVVKDTTDEWITVSRKVAHKYTTEQP